MTQVASPATQEIPNRTFEQTTPLTPKKDLPSTPPNSTSLWGVDGGIFSAILRCKILDTTF